MTRRLYVGSAKMTRFREVIWRISKVMLKSVRLYSDQQGYIRISKVIFGLVRLYSDQQGYIRRVDVITEG